MIEKYAVDMSDDVESKAIEMVKSGEQKNIGEAREKALQSLNNVDNSTKTGE